MIFARTSHVALAALAALTGACAVPPDAGSDPSPTVAQAEPEVGAVGVGQPGSHVGVHGMVLFGSKSGRLYLSHIPLYSAPHNIQVIAEVAIAAGVPEDAQAFASRNFTVRPSAFSLFDLAAGTLRSLSGTIFLGNFESGGRPTHNNVRFDVKRVVFQRAMFTNTPRNPSLDYLAVGTPAEPFLVHVIDAPPSFDHVVSVKIASGSTLDAAALELGTLVGITGGVNDVRRRPAPAAQVSVSPRGPVVAADGGAAPPDAGAPSEAAVEVVAELSCLPGNQFFGTCPAAQ